MRLRSLAVWSGIGISGIFAFFSVRDVDFQSFWDALAQGNYWLLLPAMAVLAFAIFLRALRWRVLFANEPRPPLDAVTSALLIGYLFNSILPARAGEAARVVVLNQRAGTSRSEALATVVAERVLDVLVLLALLLSSAAFITEATWLRRGAVVGGAAFVLLTLLLIALAFHGEGPVRFVMRPLSALPNVSPARVADAAANLVRGFAVFRHLGIALRALALTALSWAVIAVSFWLCMDSVRLDTGVDAALVVVIAVNLAMILPSGPAGLGVFEAATVLTLTRFGVDRSEALSYAVVVHVLNVVPLIVVGYVALHRHALAVRRSQRPNGPRTVPVAAGTSESGRSAS
jgi:glycosyltransferase 2 family protein